VDFLDNDGVRDAPLRVALDLTVAGDELVLDFSRSAPACDGPVNIARSTAVAAVYVALKHAFPEIPANAGVLDPVRFVAPDGLILTADAPRPVGGYTETILRMIDVVFIALSRAMPERVNACCYGTINALALSGRRGDGRRWVMFSFFGGGHGGNPDGDGLNHGNAPISMATIPPVEILEAAYPVLFTQWALRPDSGGSGRHRGGLGAIYEVELLDETADLFLFGERGRFAPAGVSGGGSAAPNRLAVVRGDGRRETPPMASKWVGVTLARGDRVRLESPGGGGFGPARERDPDAVRRDIEAGYVSPGAAVADDAIAESPAA
jgi:N-methylhydantoinase B